MFAVEKMSISCLVHEKFELVGMIFSQHFKPNPYFEDTKLTKTFTFLEEGTTKITATSIKWKEGMVSFHVYFEKYALYF